MYYIEPVWIRRGSMFASTDCVFVCRIADELGLDCKDWNWGPYRKARSFADIQRDFEPKPRTRWSVSSHRPSHNLEGANRGISRMSIPWLLTDMHSTFSDDTS